jgi:hypothetical protein
MKLPDKEWATLSECAYSISNHPGALPAESIKRELVARIARGEVAIRFDGELWTRDHLLTAVTGQYVTEEFCDQSAMHASELGDHVTAYRWHERKAGGFPPRDYSALTFDALPDHIEPRPTADGKWKNSKLELLTRDVEPEPRAEELAKESQSGAIVSPITAPRRDVGRPKGVGRIGCDDKILADIKSELDASPTGTSFESIALKYIDRVNMGTNKPYSILRRWRRKWAT